jgi:hypothetical protein
LSFPFSPEELESQKTMSVFVGMAEEKVKNIAGLPKARLEPGPMVITYISEVFKVIFKDVRVQRIEY